MIVERDWEVELSENHSIKSIHSIHLWSNTRRATQVLVLGSTKSQATPFVTYKTTTEIFPLQSPTYILESTMAVIHSLMEDGVFWFYINTWQVNVSTLVIYCIIELHIAVMPTCKCGFNCTPYLAYILYIPGAYLLNTYTYKRVWLLTRVYGTTLCNSRN